MLSRDVDGVVMAMRALLCQYMFDLDPTVPPIPFREEVSRFFVTVTYAIMAFKLLSFIIIMTMFTNVLILALYLKIFLIFV